MGRKKMAGRRSIDGGGGNFWRWAAVGRRGGNAEFGVRNAESLASGDNVRIAGINFRDEQVYQPAPRGGPATDYSSCGLPLFSAAAAITGIPGFSQPFLIIRCGLGRAWL